MSKRAILLGTVLLAACPALPGQQPQEPQDPRIERNIEDMRRQFADGRVIRSHVRVVVRLTNGNRINGVVKNGFLVERVDGLKFVNAEKDEKGAGLRLYYWNGNNNFVFLPFEEIKEYRVSERLTPSQLAAIEIEYREKQAAERREREREAASRATEHALEQANEPATPAGEAETPATGAESAERTVADEMQELYKLVQAYPPSQGWNAAKRDEISRRQAVVGARPSEAEQMFVDKFDQWQQACRLFGVQEPAPEAQEEGRSGRRNRRR